jgi:hypothetical protein
MNEKEKEKATKIHKTYKLLDKIKKNVEMQ